MPKFIKFFIEIIVSALVVGWLLLKFPTFMDIIGPSLILLVLWHITWEYVLKWKPIQVLAHSTYGKLRGMSWIVVFLLGGAISLLYWYGIKTALVELALMQANSATSALPAPTPDKKSPSLKELFDSGWSNLPAYYNVSYFDGGSLRSKRVTVEWRLEGDFAARSKFLSLFMSSSTVPADAETVCKKIADDYSWFIKTADSQVDITGQMPEDTMATHLKDMVFSKRVFLYYEHPDFSMTQMGELESLYKKKGLSIEFRDATYAWLHRTDYLEPETHPLTPNTFFLPDAKKSPGLVITATNLNPPPSK